MNIILVTAKFIPSKNAVAEYRKNMVHSIDDAERWLNNINKPAMFYIDGMQNHDRFLDLCCVFNKLYWKEYKKIID